MYRLTWWRLADAAHSCAWDAVRSRNMVNIERLSTWQDTGKPAISLRRLDVHLREVEAAARDAKDFARQLECLARVLPSVRMEKAYNRAQEYADNAQHWVDDAYRLRSESVEMMVGERHPHF